MARNTRTLITSPAVIEHLCQIQTRFVEAWNAAELNQGIGQTHDLPGGAIYSAAKPARGASFVLPDGSWLCIHCRAPWWHWHDGWSCCRNPISPAEVQKVVVHGNHDSFLSWLAAAIAPAGGVR
jgi:hypothetical protein